jgi:RNA polymerase sigma factor (sigma-70 family)
MPQPALLRLVRRLHARSAPAAEAPPPDDRLLLARFARSGDQAAFAALVRRHGSLVLGVCRRLLGEAEADDAFQATFLLLARKAAAVGRGGSAAPWLHGAALRVARNARRSAERRRRREGRAARANRTPAAAGPPAALAWQDVRRALDEELGRLPGPQRSALVLCYLEGLTRDEAAARLGWALGTLKRRLEEGRRSLRERLLRRGVGPLGLAAALTPSGLTAAVPSGLAASAVRVATGGSAPAAVAVLAGPALRPGQRAALLGLALLTAGAVVGGGVARPAASESADPPPVVAAAPAGEPDRPGDPLPDGAVARMGTLTLRHGEYVRTLQFTADGRRVFSAGPRSMRLWDTATGREVGGLDDPEPNGEFLAAALGPDGRTAVTVTTAGWTAGEETCQEWDVPTRQVRRQFSLKRQLLSNAFDRAEFFFSPGGRTLAIREGDRSVRLYDVASGKERHRLAGDWRASAVAFSADGRAVVTGDEKRGLCAWDVDSGRELCRFGGGGQPVHALAVSPDGKWLASVGMTVGRRGDMATYNPAGAVRLWDFATGAEARTIEMTTAPGGVAGVAFSPDGQSLIASGWVLDPFVGVWDVATGRKVRDLPRHVSAAVTLAVSPDGRALATTSTAIAEVRGIIRVCDPTTGEERPRFGGPRDAVRWLAFTPDGQAVNSFSNAGVVRRWEARTGLPLPLAESTAVGTAASADGRWLALSDRLAAAGPGNPDPRMEVRVLERATGQVRGRLTAPAGGMTPSPDGRRLATAGTFDHTVRVWDTADGRELRALRVDDRWRPRLIGFTPDGRLLTCAQGGPEERNLRTWAAATGAPLGSWDVERAVVENARGLDSDFAFGAAPAPDSHSFRLHGAALSPDGRTLALSVFWMRSAGQPHSNVVLVDSADRRVLHYISYAGATATALAFSPDGKLLAAGWSEWNAALFETATGREVRQLVGHRGAVQSLAFSPDGSLLASGSDDATALVWDLRPKPAGPLRPPAELWAALAGEDAATAYRAIGQLAAQPGAAVPFLRERLRPVPPLDAPAVANRIADLDSDKPVIRQAATRALAGYGRRVEPALRRALAAAPPLELRQRIQRLLDGFADEPTDELREGRAVAALEWAGTPAARALLAELAGGDPDAPLTRDARAALDRLGRQTR